MVGAPRFWAQPGHSQACSHAVHCTGLLTFSPRRFPWTSARVHPDRTQPYQLQSLAANSSKNCLCKSSLCGCLLPRTRSVSAASTWRSHRVFASWGQDIEWTNVKVSSNGSAAKQLNKLVIDVGSLAEGYKTAGQFMQIKVGDSKPGFFAIASAPDSNNQGLVEVLIKDGPPDSTASLLCNISSGAEVSVSPVMGKGFRMERAPTTEHPTCLLFATGSGISPIKALIESNELQGRQEVRLYYGTRNSDATAYSDLDESWKSVGVDTVHVYSDEDKGYVQDVFSQNGLDFDPSKTCAVMVGHKEMCEAVTKILESKGVSKEHILLNF
ncbi:hypothetical protein ABBQ38_008334 [Trebouxia sp. C0009 RCD-2024]